MIYNQGPLEAVLTPTLVAELYGAKTFSGRIPEQTGIQVKTVFDDPENKDSDVLIQMTDVTVKYGKTVVLDRLNWQMKKNENWYVSGPNGAGKSTLISLITADNPQAYSNEVCLFGKKRGTGETIWDIKQKIGLISSEFQIRYNIAGTRITAYQVVLSGFFDSVGLFRHADAKQRRIARQWLQTLGMASYAERTFQHLSYADRMSS